MEQRNRREQNQTQKKTRKETEIIHGKHFNLKSVSESFQCVLIFTVKQNNSEMIPKWILNRSVSLCLFVSLLAFVFWFCFPSVSLFHSFKSTYWSIIFFFTFVTLVSVYQHLASLATHLLYIHTFISMILQNMFLNVCSKKNT